MSFLEKIQHRIWNNAQYKFSIIFCSIYVVLFFGKSIPEKIILYILVSILLSIGVAGMGYVFNDWNDYKDDVKNKKRNLFVDFSKMNSVFLVVLFLVLSVFPWFILPFDKTSFVLIGLEFFLFLVYAFPPFRLKEKGIVGVVADALYAQVVPCLLATYTFSKITSDVEFSFFFIIIYVIWLLFMGIRNILNHQLDDYANDKNSKTNTFVIQNGIEKSSALVYRFLIPIEFLLFIGLLYSLPLNFPIFLLVYLLYMLIYILVFYFKQSTIKTNTATLFEFFNKRLLNEFYEIHLPIILLLFFSFYNPFFIWILILNLIMFSQLYYHFILNFIRKYF
ncbi:MAG: UbiA family prenyltransferase [Chitinophagales bacterium]|nr:UbiA family prenyltransferase [Bacteroidota bacterium]